MKIYQSLLVLLLLAGCGPSQSQREEEFNTSVETLKNLQQLQKLNAEMKIGELERENENLRAKVTSLEVLITSLQYQEDHGASKTETKAGTPVPIVEEGEFIVVNPAGSTRYLMVEILLIRKEPDDNGFPEAVKENRKQLEAHVSNVLSALSAEEMAEPSIRNGMPNQLKKLFQTILGSSHPIDKVIIPKWVMQ